MKERKTSEMALLLSLPSAPRAASAAAKKKEERVREHDKEKHKRI